MEAWKIKSSIASGYLVKLAGYLGDLPLPRERYIVVKVNGGS